MATSGPATLAKREHKRARGSRASICEVRTPAADQTHNQNVQNKNSNISPMQYMMIRWRVRNLCLLTKYVRQKSVSLRLAAHSIPPVYVKSPGTRGCFSMGLQTLFETLSLSVSGTAFSAIVVSFFFVFVIVSNMVSLQVKKHFVFNTTSISLPVVVFVMMMVASRRTVMIIFSPTRSM
jgi:hypothetical protein